MNVWTILWKTPVVFVALVIGSIAACQIGWSGAALAVNSPLSGITNLLDDLFLVASVGISIGCVLLVKRIAKPFLWVMMPILLYCGVVLGAWDGVACDFDSIRLQALRHHYANAYALGNMTDRGRFLSCKDDRIELTEDAKAVCLQALTVGPGERIPGSEYTCGPLGMFGCFSTEPDVKKPSP